MAQSKCSKCDSIKFEAIPAKPEHLTFPLTFVQCAQCGAVFGVLESSNINDRLDKMGALLSQINVSLAMLRAK